MFQEQRPLSLQVGIPGLLDTLAFDDDSYYKADLDADEVEIKPCAYGLNFRDVMVAMDELREPTMGVECAGIVTRVGPEAAAQGFAVGDAVMALLLGPSLQAVLGSAGTALPMSPQEWTSTTLRRFLLYSQQPI